MTIHFPDLSHFKTPPLDGAVALITKATQGSAYVDPTYARFRDDAQARGIPFCGYHWVDTSDLAAQAALAWRVMGGVPCMWDAEAAGATVPRLAELTRRYRAMGGNPRLVYLPHWWWQDHLGSPSLQPLADAGLSLVSSAYPAAGYSETGIGWAGYGGMSPAIWQWSDAAPFNGARVDMNAYRGTVEQLRALFTGQGDDMTWDQKTSDNAAFTLLDGGDHKPVHVRLQEVSQALARVEAKLSMPAPVTIDPAALAAALADPAFKALLVEAAKEGANLAEDA